MQKKNSLILFLKIMICISQLFSCKQKSDNVEFKELSKIFQELNICLNIDELKWHDSLKKDSNLEEKWRYFCDTTYFKIYKISSHIPITEALLLEVKINYGSGEYDNYVIKKSNKGYKITCEFKGYLDSILVRENEFNKFIYDFNTNSEKRCRILGTFNGESIVTDTILNFDVSECKQAFIKGIKWCE